MRRREFIALLAASVAWPFAALAQQPGRTYRVGGLSVGPRNGPVVAAMFDELRRFGFIEGQNLTIDWRQYTLHIDLISEFAADLVKAKVDVIYAVGDAAIRAAQRATTTIPILGSTDDMVEAGLVKSLARPEGNTTGTSILSAELDGKRQEILIEAVPGLHRMAALADSNRTAGSRLSRLQALNEEAHLRNVELSVHQIAKPEEIPAAIDAAKTSGAAALNLLSSPLLYGNRQLIMDRVAALRLPTIYFFPEVAEEGGFVAYGARVVELFREVMARSLCSSCAALRLPTSRSNSQLSSSCDQPEDR
jgi:putative tryptophan/tyrosine transport system substrate-binding protein